MKTTALGSLMTANAVLFFFGAALHAGVTIAGFQEPRIIPATIVEAICGIWLLLGAIVAFAQFGSAWNIALLSNLVALTGVLIGIGALAVGAGPRTVSNDVYHGIMLVLIGTSLIVLYLGR